MIKIDPRLVQSHAKWQQAREAYTRHDARFNHSVPWPMLSPEDQKRWYDAHMSK